MSWDHWPVWLYIAAVLTPLGVFFLELLAGKVLGRLNAPLSTAAIAAALVLSVTGFITYLVANPDMLAAHVETSAIVEGSGHPEGPAHGEHHPGAWNARFTWVLLGAGLLGEGSPALEIPLVVRIDNLAAIMFVMVSLIATLIHIYSIAYMRDDPRYPRFFMYLSLFCFSMLGLVASGSIFLVFVFWELVGICSYLLIGFWYEEKPNADAANKAFLVNRVGDVGMLIGLGALWACFGTFSIAEINTGLRDPSGALNVVAPATEAPAVELRDPATGEPMVDPGTSRPYRMPLWLLGAAGLGIFAGCVGKSAQFPLHVWLPDAMAGPTPVSALIHAATMVAAGVYLVGRFYPLFTGDVLLVIAYTGGITLFLAATIAIVQNDYKKVLAYSTVSQLGFMMLGLGVGGWAAGLFHLLTHAFFKALLFLGAGSIHHAVHTYEMAPLGGLRRRMPVTAATMLVGTLAISGVPFFSGFYSKDAILGTALAFVAGGEGRPGNPRHILLFLLPAVGALMTAFYMFRLWFRVFDGEPRGHAAEHAHESERLITVPLIVLAVFAVFVGWPITGGLPFFGIDPFLEHWLVYGAPLRAIELGGAKWWAMGASVVIAAAGIAAAAAYYSRWRRLDAEAAAVRLGGLYRFLVHKWYFDEVYDAVFVRPTLALARGASSFDKRFIDGIVDGTAFVAVGLSRLDGLFDRSIVDGVVNRVGTVTYAIGDWARTLQTGRVRNYLMILAVGMVILFLGVYRWIS